MSELAESRVYRSWMRLLRVCMSFLTLAKTATSLKMVFPTAVEVKTAASGVVGGSFWT